MESDVVMLLMRMEVQKIDNTHGLVSNWSDGTKYRLSYDEREKTISIAGNRAALTSLARHLLTLAQPDSMPGHNLHWEPTSGWFETDEAGLHISLVE